MQIYYIIGMVLGLIDNYLLINYLISNQISRSKILAIPSRLYVRFSQLYFSTDIDTIDMCGFLALWGRF